MVDVDSLVIDDPERGLFRVHQAAFTDAAIFEVEKATIFADAWIYAAHASELPSVNSFLTRRVGGKDIIITRPASGPIRALANVCLHRGAMVCREKSGCQKIFTCPYHNWSYDGTGALIGLPSDDAYAGTAFDRSERGLRSVRLEEYRGFLFVNRSAKAPPLADWLGQAKEYLDLVAETGASGMEIVGGTHQYAIRANWKLVAENGMDHYHFRILHRRYIDFLRSLGEEGAGPPKATITIGRYLGAGHGAHEHDQMAVYGRLAGTFGPLHPEAIKPHIEANRLRLEETLGPEQAKRIARHSRNLRVFPNLFILDNNTISVRTFFPIDHERVEATEWSLGAKDEPPAVRETRLRTHLSGPGSFVTPDDIEALEITQRGLANGDVDWLDYTRGMKREPLHTDESHHRGFFRHWHELVTQGRVRHPATT